MQALHCAMSHIEQQGPSIATHNNGTLDMLWCILTLCMPIYTCVCLHRGSVMRLLYGGLGELGDNV